MRRINLINKGVTLARTLEARECPAGLVSLLEEVGVEARRGKKVCLTPDQAARFLLRLKSHFELSPQVLSNPHFKIKESTERISLAKHIANEKIGGGSVTAARGAIKGPVIAFRESFWRPFEYLSQSEIRGRLSKGVIVVENWQAFDWMPEISFEIPARFSGLPVVYRGDPELRQDICEAAIREGEGPVVVFPDFDPAGLVNALAVPRMSDILWPGASGLEAALQAHASSEKKYGWQVADARKVLQACRHPDVMAIWKIIDEWGRVPSQEVFFQSERPESTL